MAKIAFTKLGISKNLGIGKFTFNDQEVEVKAYLPIEEKIEIVQSVIEQAKDQNNFPNVMKLEMFLGLECVFHCTNVSFTEKQKENLPELYDKLLSSGFLDDVKHVMGTEYTVLLYYVESIANEIYKYKNSILGILETVSQDYNNLDLDVTKIQEEINDPNSIPLLKDIMTKLG